MKGKQFIRKLRKAGVAIEERRGKGGHVLARYRGKQTTIPVHGDTDLGPIFLRQICRQLGLDPKDVL